MTTCRAWTTTCCAAAARPATSNTTNRPPCWSATACRPLAFELLASQPLGDPQQQLEMIALLAHASGSRGMAGGQAIDLASVGSR
jgi:hypothetical protein